MDSYPVIGWKEWLFFPELGIPAIKAKIDTGARTSALHTFSLETFEQEKKLMVRFGIHPVQKKRDIEIYCVAPVIDYRRIKDSGGHIEKRYVIETSAVMGGVQWPVQITLTNRDKMMFRMLLGRRALENRFIVNPWRSYLTGKKLSKSYSGMEKNRRIL
ncbi:ATP-dependent zinc protease [Desulfospira joergensenii]|uniref:ATP-dependent zinc protease family protein n=1 Tax=Desulfospira joergensenii TaxID=53329 RepID=UPI0003FBD67B|nr:ATP-dependent zinc protease [Desulfospira joergensenii]